MTPKLDLAGDVVRLAAALVDIPSVSGSERQIADAVEAALRALPHLSVERDGDTIRAGTRLARSERVAVAGHLDTVPPAGNLPSRRADGVLFGLGSCDMKGGVAVALHLAATVPAPARDVSYLFYECEEVEFERNGLTRIARTRPDWLAADFAVLMEPTGAVVEGGCQGSLHLQVRTRGSRAHTARAWMGHNAIHAAGDVLARLTAYEPRRPVVDGLEYREGLQAVGIGGGVAGNVVPDDCTISVNYRFAPDRGVDAAIAHVRDVFAGYDVAVLDASPPARPGLATPPATAFLAAVGGSPRAKFGWTDVARFAATGVPAVNYGPGDPALAHTPDEHVAEQQIRDCADRMGAWLRDD